MLYILYLCIYLFAPQLCAQEIPGKNLITELELAIKKSNLNKVDEIMPQLTSLSDRDKRYFLDIAQEVIERRRNKIKDNEKDGLFVDWKATLLMTGSFLSIVLSIKLLSARETEGALIFSSIGIPVFIYGFLRGTGTWLKKREKLNKKYEDAIKIKQYFYT